MQGGEFPFAYLYPFGHEIFLHQFGVFGKPLHLTLAAPSEPVTQMMLAAPEGGEPVDPNCGFWRKPWSPLVQSRWLETVLQICMSKPFVESVAWQDLMDHPQIEMPLSGLLAEDMTPKTALRRVINFRRNLSANSAAAAARSGTGSSRATAGGAGSVGGAGGAGDGI